MTITAGDLDSSAFNIQGIGFATGLAGPLVGCRDSAADNFNIDTGGVYGTVGAYIMFNTHSDPGDPNECLYTGCMDQTHHHFFLQYIMVIRTMQLCISIIVLQRELVITKVVTIF